VFCVRCMSRPLRYLSVPTGILRMLTLRERHLSSFSLTKQHGGIRGNDYVLLEWLQVLLSWGCLSCSNEAVSFLPVPSFPEVYHEAYGPRYEQEASTYAPGNNRRQGLLPSKQQTLVCSNDVDSKRPRLTREEMQPQRS